MAKFESDVKYLPSLPLEERDRRWLLLRERMVSERLDYLLLVGNEDHWGMGMANVRYLTHISSQGGAFVFFPVAGDPVVWCGLPHQFIPDGKYFYKQDWVDDVRPERGPAPVVTFLKEHKYDRGTIGLVSLGSTIRSGFISASVYEYFCKELPNAKITDATGLVQHLQIIKSPAEIAMLEKAAKLAKKTLDTMIQSAEPGKKECELFADMVHTQISNGGEPQIFIFFSSGPWDGSGDKTLLHGTPQPVSPTMRPLALGDIIMTEFHASWGGYLAAVEFGLCLGPAPKELKRIREVQVQCLEVLLEKMRPGAMITEVWKAMQKPVEDAGMEFVELGFHGHGLVSAMIPTIVYKSESGDVMSGQKYGELQFRENMVFGTNIDVYDPKWNKTVGLMLGDTLHITKEGTRRLVGIPLDFLEKLF